MIPLIKALKTKYPKAHLSGLFFDAYQCRGLFEHFDIFDVCIQASYPSTLLKHRFYDQVYIDWLSCTRKTMLIAYWCSKKIITHNKNLNLPSWLLSKVVWKDLPIHTHIGSMNKALCQENSSISIDEFQISTLEHTSSQKHILIQPGCGNGKTPYKSWGEEKWEAFMAMILEITDYNIVLVGDRFDIKQNKTLAQLNKHRIKDVTNRTPLPEVVKLMNEAHLFLGQDSAFMHLAAVLDTPSISLFGGSDPLLYGYEQLSTKHCVVRSVQSCQPCNSWLKPNTSRVSNPLDCPDFKCLKEMSVSQVYTTFVSHLKDHCLAK